MMSSGRAARTVTIGGQEYKIRPRPFSDWAQLQAWLADNIPGPVERTLIALRRLDRLGLKPTQRERQEMIAAAQDVLWPPRVMSNEWLLLFDLPWAAERFLEMALGPDNPGLTPEYLTEIRRKGSILELLAAMHLAYGEVPETRSVDKDEDEDDGESEGDDPKAPPPTPNSGASSSSG